MTDFGAGVLLGIGIGWLLAALVSLLRSKGRGAAVLDITDARKRKRAG